MLNLISRDGQARAGELHLNGKVIKTPFFMPVATKGSVKYMNPLMLKNAGVECIISNSLIFYWNPGLEVVEKAGGLHNFINWHEGIFTDSGGFQSLDESMLIETTPDFASFKSPFNGQVHEITPEKAIDIQNSLGSDVAMCLDHVPKYNDDYRAVRSKTLRTHSWARRCKEHHDKLKTKQLLFGIVQGGNFIEMRKKSIEFLEKLDFGGIAQGGLAIGEPVEKMYEMLKETTPLMPENKPRYVMGVGNPLDILECISHGIDCFDSTFPTQNARHGTLFTFNGGLKLLQKQYRNDHSSIEESCSCFACKNYSRAFIRHLLKNREGVGFELATIHNISFMQRLMEKIRKAIKMGRFNDLKNDLWAKYSTL
ncbi:MAG: tRNA guanosine(34) transglycosylase Tgt [Nanoarchaeota archaeon]